MKEQHEARRLFDEALQRQRTGDLEGAIELYRESIALHPTAEAHTFLGWTYSWQGRVDDAIAECKKAIEVDPTLGNPYNDIGVYLIGQGELDEAISWLEKATTAERYECRHFPWMNLGRIYAAKEMQRRAVECFQRAVELKPGDPATQQALLDANLLLQ